MNTTLDGKALFDEQDLQIEIDSPQRASIERSIPRLDGVLSIDLGQRSRKVRQRGTLHAASHTQMQARTDVIKAFIDGHTHILATTDGQIHRQLRMDVFRLLDSRPGGPGVVVEYEITYTQLGA